MIRNIITTIAIVILGLFFGTTIQAGSQVASASIPIDLPAVGMEAAIPTAVPTPLVTQATSIYEVDSKEPANTLTLVHTFKNQDGTVRYTFTDTLAPGATRQYHVTTMTQIPNPWVGTVEIVITNWTLAQPAVAGIVGYDYGIYNCPAIQIIKGQ
jgi:hypothetical protein